MTGLGASISPAMLALIKPQLKTALEQFVQADPPAEAARKALPLVQELIAPALRRDAGEMLIELGLMLQTRGL